MPARRHFAFGVVVAAVLIAPTLAGMSAAAPGENALAVFAAARSQIEAQVSTSVQMLAANLADWIAREAAKL